MVQESIDLACAEMNEEGEHKLTLTQIAARLEESRSTVQGYAERGRALVQEEDAAPVEPDSGGLARDGAPERIEA